MPIRRETTRCGSLPGSPQSRKQSRKAVIGVEDDGFEWFRGGKPVALGGIPNQWLACHTRASSTVACSVGHLRQHFFKKKIRSPPPHFHDVLDSLPAAGSRCHLGCAQRPADRRSPPFDSTRLDKHFVHAWRSRAGPNMETKLDNSPLRYVNFNQDSNCFSVGKETGYDIFNSGAIYGASLLVVVVVVVICPGSDHERTNCVDHYPLLRDTVFQGAATTRTMGPSTRLWRCSLSHRCWSWWPTAKEGTRRCVRGL